MTPPLFFIFALIDMGMILHILNIMTTQMVFKIDNKLKQAIAFAPAPTPEIPNARTARILRQISKDVKAGKNLSPTFSNAEDAIQYLGNYVRRPKHRN